ncbi:hypothetical protein [Streptomyces sp. NPDC001348]
MFALELQQARTTELHRQAEAERLVREVVRQRRTARREAAVRRGAEPEAHTRVPRRDRLARAA